MPYSKLKNEIESLVKCYLFVARIQYKSLRVKIERLNIYLKIEFSCGCVKGIQNPDVIDDRLLLNILASMVHDVIVAKEEMCDHRASIKPQKKESLELPEGVVSPKTSSGPFTFTLGETKPTKEGMEFFRSIGCEVPVHASFDYKKLEGDRLFISVYEDGELMVKQVGNRSDKDG